ncbi:uncharacterized protein LOC119458298 isoform X15 [Dermacentor silvarum]|uniref:uncharacterized protein LOC119458298 isoform X13 n=1 Tax=Dermacentor silvarum TaxID=543639 RepID=UPI0021014E14|nr:uncharacterized protein LOC119458298 isoform X13 [Dermacentor silvarum]XP_049526995.1 uncharacterized protein LOC119458298 isoform X14 [Dermacentor silvarum]XP_049526996.1 uncharacterized protein LOC119458298 isoform X15 [Dermacentor silvarum]
MPSHKMLNGHHTENSTPRMLGHVMATKQKDIKNTASQKISGYLQGTLNPDNVDRMFIFNQGIPYNQTENVVYLSTKLRCAVIKVTTLPGMQTIYDLRVRNFSITRGPSRGCMRKWTKLTNKSHSIYAPICQGILHSKTEPEFNTGAKPTPKNEHRH